MKYLDGFRDPKAAAALRGRIHDIAARLAPAGHTLRIMEVCGSHTMAISRHGIRGVLPPCIELISGPGCPVCVTDTGYIDAAIELAHRHCIIATFGDLINVPGSTSSLARSRAEGSSVEVCYSPSDALDLARRYPDRDVVFLGIGFETTIPAVVSIVETASRASIANISLLTAFKLVPPALSALLKDPDMNITAFLCPAHVSAIIGTAAYEPFSGSRGVPCVIAGFEPLDILAGILAILMQVEKNESRVENLYTRVVRPEGNPLALDLMARTLTPVDATWRGLGPLPASGLVLRPEFAHFDASIRHSISMGRGIESPGCLCGEVVKGKRKPTDCPMFGTRCVPDDPVGPCMVSSEGTCAAYFKYATIQDT